MLIDTHAHLTMSEFFDLQDVLDRAKKAGVEAIVNASFDTESSHKSTCLSDDVDFIYASVGIHPNHASEATEENLSKIKRLAQSKKVVAIGEIGLDYYHKDIHPDIQKEVFVKFIRLAKELSLPMIIHSREADDDTIEIMKNENVSGMKAVFHCFAGSEKLEKFAYDSGFMVSYTVNITFKKADIIRASAKRVPVEKIMVETDCPYLAPQVFRGQRSEPAFVYYVAEEISKIKNISLDEVSDITTRNAKQFFNIL